MYTPGLLVYRKTPKTPKISVGIIMSSFWDQSDLHNQYFASFAASLGGLAVGASVGWSSPAQEFLATKSFLEFSWISGALWLGFAIPVGLLAHYYGRKLILLLIVGLLNLGGWALLIWIPDIYYVVLARFFHGLAAGTYFIVTPLYIMEVTKKDTFQIAGRCLHEVFYAIGILFAFGLGNFRNYDVLCYGCALSPVPFLLFFIWMPETPFFYLSHGKVEKADESMQWLRGEHYNTTLELTNLQREIEQQRNNSQGLIQALKHWRTLKFLIIGILLVFLQHFTGSTAVISYVNFLFLESGATEFDALLSCMCFGLSMLLGILIAIGLLNVMEPRVLLILSCTLVLMLTAAVGGHCQLRKIEDPFLGHVTWLSVVGLCAYIFSRALGLGTLIFYLMSKLLRPEVRNLGFGLIYSLSGIFGFVNVKFFPNLLMAWGQSVVFFSYTGIGGLGLFFIYIMLPEIRNMTVMEMQMDKPTVQDALGKPVVKVQKK